MSLSQAVATILIYAVGQAAAANDALNANPTVANADLTTHGSDWLWAVFALMLATGLGIIAWAFMIPPGQRAFHWIGIAILFTASVAYFSMASDLGATPIAVEFVRYKSDLYTGTTPNPYTRSIWYVRYIDWVITTPLLLLELLLATGMPLSGIFGALFFDEVMIITGLVGALVRSSYKWGYFTGGCVALLYVSWVLIIPARANAKAIGDHAHSAYLASAGILCFLWLLYPVAWGLADGGNVISTDAEMVFYGILDVLAKPVFLVFHLFALRKVPYEAFQLQSGHFSAYSTLPATPNPRASNGGLKTTRAVSPVVTEKKVKPTKVTTKKSKAVAPVTDGANVEPHGAATTNTLPGEMHIVNNTEHVINGTRSSGDTAV